MIGRDKIVATIGQMFKPALAQAFFANVDGRMVTASVRSSSGASRPFLVFPRLPLDAVVAAALLGIILAFPGFLFLARFLFQ